ncbi:MAG: hypothetical protein ACTSPI_04290 [Candidatus Heimdallarchaeaceae archaeon]
MQVNLKIMTKITIDGKEMELPEEFISAIKSKVKEEVKEEIKEEIKEKEGPITLGFDKRNCHYQFDTKNNPLWKGQEDVWLKESVAISFHNEFIRRGAKYLGDQNGNTTPPRDSRALKKVGEKPAEICKKIK